MMADSAIQKRCRAACASSATADAVCRSMSTRLPCFRYAARYCRIDTTLSTITATYEIAYAPMTVSQDAITIRCRWPSRRRYAYRVSYRTTIQRWYAQVRCQNAADVLLMPRTLPLATSEGQVPRGTAAVVRQPVCAPNALQKILCMACDGVAGMI